MDIQEFNDVVKPYSHGDDELILDVRPFGSRQGEAVDAYLRARLVHVNTTGMGNTNRLVVFMCDADAQIPDAVMTEIENLAACGQWAEIRHACAEKAFAESA